MERLKKILTKNINIKTTYMLVLIVVSIGLMVTCFSYALFTAREESTCQMIKPDELPEIYEKETIIKYAVNDTEEYYFHVIHDDGDTLTMNKEKI